MFTENHRRPWGTVIAVLALLTFSAIIGASLLFAGTFCPWGIGLGCKDHDDVIPSGATTVSATATPAPPAEAVEILYVSSNAKEDWIKAVTDTFNAAQIRTPAGRPVFVRVSHVTSGGSQKDILDGKIKPTVWSPGDQSWIDGANQVWRDRYGQPLVSRPCPPTIYIPIGFVMWRPMAEALGWPDTPISWDTIVDLAASPEGWAKYGHPEWGAFRFGHTHPDYSNSGLLIMTALVYSTLGTTTGLTPAQIKSPEVIEAMRHVELHTFHYGVQNRDLINLMAKRGPAYLHAANSSEAEVLKGNTDYKDKLRFPLVFIFPAEGTFWTEQPYCVLEADWVTAEQREAAELYRKYLLDPAQQALAIDYGLRPVDPNIELHPPLALEYGTNPEVTPETVPALASPSGEAAAAVKDVFHQTKKKATIIIALDTSGSMQGVKITNALEATANFLNRLEKDDQVYVYAFNTTIIELQPAGRAGDVVEDLRQTILGLYAKGDTALYDTVCLTTRRVAELRAADTAAGDRRLYGIVVLSDGQDTASKSTVNDMFNCLPSGEDVEGVKLFTIVYGEDADKDLLLRMANRTNGKTFSGDPETIEKVYTAISAEQ